MSNLINAQPRFGYDPATNTIYDYVAQRDIPLANLPEGTPYRADDGEWNLHAVAVSIQTGAPIHTEKHWRPSTSADAGTGEASAKAIQDDQLRKDREARRAEERAKVDAERAAANQQKAKEEEAQKGGENASKVADGSTPAPAAKKDAGNVSPTPKPAQTDVKADNGKA
jgi:regulator of protease activity HflC (stomatin/prohibitin superfamily)